jgi:hypothetical protein
MLSELAIWRHFQKEITESELKEISEADYGYDAEEHFRLLKNILLSGKLPDRLEWEPREVLGLVSWCEYWKEGSTALVLANFCAVVLLAASERKLSNEHLDGQIEKMIIAIDSSKLLGNGRTENLYEFFQYLVPKVKLQEVEEDFLYFNISLFILASFIVFRYWRCSPAPSPLGALVQNGEAGINVGALYAQNFKDPVVLSAVNELESLTTGLSRKVRHKIMILHKLDEMTMGAEYGLVDESQRSVEAVVRK